LEHGLAKFSFSNAYFSQSVTLAGERDLRPAARILRVSDAFRVLGQEFLMKPATLTRSGLLAGALALAGFLAACDRTVSEEVKTEHGPNGTTVKRDTVVQHPDGTVTEEKDKST